MDVRQIEKLCYWKVSKRLLLWKFWIKNPQIRFLIQYGICKALSNIMLSILSPLIYFKYPTFKQTVTGIKITSYKRTERCAIDSIINFWNLELMCLIIWFEIVCVFHNFCYFDSITEFMMRLAFWTSLSRICLIFVFISFFINGRNSFHFYFPFFYIYL